MHVELNRPRMRNALNKQLWTEIGAAFDALANDPDCRAIVLSGAGTAFCSGIDFKEMMTLGGGDQELDVSRRAWKLRSTIEQFQRCMSSAEKVRFAEFDSGL